MMQNDQWKIKIECWPAFLNRCDIELSNGQLLVIVSAFEAHQDNGSAYPLVISPSRAATFKQDIEALLTHPTEQQSLVIADGISIKLQLVQDGRTMTRTIHSIESDTPEQAFFLELIDFISSKLNQDELSKYLQKLRQDYL